MIPACLIDGDSVGIPIYNSADYCYIIWKEDETYEDALIRASKKEDRITVRVWTTFKVWPKDESEDETDSSFKLFVYEIESSKTGIPYYLISYGEITKFDDMHHCVCVPYNQLNLLKFYNEYLSPFGRTIYRHAKFTILRRMR